MSDASSYTVPPERSGAKLDRLIQDFAQLSRREARLLIASGRVRVNRRAVRILARPINAGAQIDIVPGPLHQQAASHAPSSGRPQGRLALPELVYLDRHVVVLNKPAGLLSETDRFGSPSLQTLVPKVLRARGERETLWLVHRLDAGTSGIVIMARTPAAAAHLSTSFREALARKTYLALCQGVLHGAQDVDAPIARAQGTRHAVLPHGKAAQTHVMPVASAPGVSLARCAPKTGRTHQIRVHLAHVGHPIVGDRLYGGPGYAPSAHAHAAIFRPMLHALKLDIAHPKDGRRLIVEAPVPRDMLQAAHNFGLDISGCAPHA